MPWPCFTTTSHIPPAADAFAATAAGAIYSTAPAADHTSPAGTDLTATAAEYVYFTATSAGPLATASDALEDDLSVTAVETNSAPAVGLAAHAAYHPPAPYIASDAAPSTVPSFCLNAACQAPAPPDVPLLFLMIILNILLVSFPFSVYSALRPLPLLSHPKLQSQMLTSDIHSIKEGQSLSPGHSLRLYCPASLSS